ncbi:MAG: hypothetical protein Q9179_007517 [Wetmoreana sp. 5 TL-2023]
MVMLPKDPAVRQESIAVLEAAMASDNLAPSLIPASAARVTRFKAQFLTWENALDARRPKAALTAAHASLALQTYRASVTAISPSPSPLIGLAPSSILLLLTPAVPRRHPSSPTDPFEVLGRALTSSFPRVRHVPYTLSMGLTGVHHTFLQRAAAVILVLCNISSAMLESQDELVKAVQDALQARDATPGQQRSRKIVIGTGDPRDLRDDFTGWWIVCCYHYSKGALEAVAEVVLGQREATGRLPT